MQEARYWVIKLVKVTVVNLGAQPDVSDTNLD
jgi:hypothetical protein